MLLLLKSNTAGALAASVTITLTVAATLTVTPASGAALAASVPVTVSTVAALNATTSSFTASVPITIDVVANLTIRPPAALLSAVAVRVTTAANLTAPAGNLTAATATTITLPWSSTQDVNVGGVTKTVWYKVTPTADGMITIWAFGDLVTYKPRLQIFSPDGVTDHPTGTGINVPIQFYGLTGVPYFFKIDSSTGNVSPAVLTLTASALVATTAPVGSFAVPDDHVGLPLGLFSATVSNTPLTYTLPFPTGYNADVLANGVLGIEDNTNENANGAIVFKLINAAGAAIATLTWSMPSSGWQQTSIGGNRVDRFYVGWAFDFDNAAGASSFRVVQQNGTAGPVVALTGVTTLTGLAPNNADTVLYVAARQGAGDYRIKQWDLVNGVFLADLAGNVADYRPHDLLVLSNGSVVVLYQQVSGGNRRIIVYSSAGAVVSTTNYGAYDTRLAYDADYTVFWAVMLGTLSSGDLGSATFRKVNPATGADLVTRAYFGFDNGVYEGVATATPPPFGISADSSPFWLTRALVEPPPPPAGTLIVQKTTDTADPDAEFTFTVDGGLSPATFTLKHGESRTFADITPGTYAVAETILPTGWTLGSAVVSNGDLVSAITIDDGETVTALFTNVAPPVAEHVCPPATESIACWSGFTGAELQIRRVAE